MTRISKVRSTITISNPSAAKTAAFTSQVDRPIVRTGYRSRPRVIMMYAVRLLTSAKRCSTTAAARHTTTRFIAV